MSEIDRLKKQDNSNTPKNLRPSNFDDYIGQEELKNQLSIFIQAALSKGSNLPHTLLFGPPGLGKTTLATIIANEMDSKIVYTSAPAIEKPADLASLLLSLEDNDILFIDEVHRLKKIAEEVLYPAMEDSVIDITINSAGENKIIRLPLKKFTLIAATTKPGVLSKPFRDRFIINRQLKFYKQKEIEKIIYRTTKIIGLKITENACKEIAKRSRGTARIANNLLSMVGDYAIVKNNSKIDEFITVQALNDLNIDQYGLEYIDRKLMFTIFYIFKNSPVGVKSLSSYLGEDSDTIEFIIEPYLIQKNLLNKTPRGRTLTDKGIDYAEKNLRESEFN
jgi:Holliday junction DNA helicase RuvB